MTVMMMMMMTMSMTLIITDEGDGGKYYHKNF